MTLTEMTAEDYRNQMRASLEASVGFFFIGYMMEQILERVASENQMNAEVLSTGFNISHAMMVVGVVGGVALAVYSYVRANQLESADKGQVSDASTHSRETSSGSFERGLTASPFTFGTFRRVDEMDAVSGTVCTRCGDSATHIRKYEDLKVRFGIAFGTIREGEESYCEDCVQNEDVVREGWSPDIPPNGI